MKKLLIAAMALFSMLFAEESKDITRQFDLRNKTSLTAEDINKHLKGVLENKGEQFKEAEEKYNINACFLVAVAIFESANGTSNKAKTRKNCFGLRGKSFNTVDEGIDYTAMILTSPTGYYYGRKKYTIEKIGNTYAPTWDNPGNKKWIPSVISLMKKMLNSNVES